MTTFTTDSALRELGVSENILSAEEKNALDQEGFIVLENVLSPGQLDSIRARMDELLALEKEEAGKEVHQEAGTARLANLVDKGDVFRIFYTQPKLLAAMAHVLKHDMKLSALNSRTALPGQGRQALHADWGGGVTPGDYQVCNSIWLIDDFTTENGATRLVPRSHLTGQAAAEAMKDPAAPHPSEKIMTGPAGSMVIFNSHVWHGGTLNRTNRPRRSITSYWTRRGQPQQLDNKKYLGAATIEGLSAPLRYLLDV